MEMAKRANGTGKEKIRGSRSRRYLDLIVGAPVLWALGSLRSRKPIPAKIDHVVLMQTAAIGDTLLMAGAIRCLRARFPHARLTLVVGKDNAGVVALLPKVDEVVSINVLKPWSEIQKLKDLNADVLIDYGTWPRINALLAAFSGARYTIGFKTRGQARHFAYDEAVHHSPTDHEVFNQQRLLTPLTEIDSWELRIECPTGISSAMEGVHEPFVVFHPWASGSGKQLKEWPEDKWCEVAAWCIENGIGIVVTGGRQDIEVSERLIARVKSLGAGALATSMAGKLNLAGTAKLLSDAFAVVSVNTGIMHLAALLGAPTIGLHGPTNMHRWGPVGEKTVSLQPRSGRHGYLNLGFEFPPEAEPCMQHLDSADVTSILGKWKSQVEE
jgi:ADP-heptose:LPS heptosyltransferase